MNVLRLFWYMIAAGIIAFSWAHASAETPEQTILVYEEATKHGIDPDLALSIVEVESAFNPKAVGSLGERGLFQLRPEYHGESAVFDEKANVKGGVKYLSTLYSACKSKYGEAWFVCYNTGPNAKPLKRPLESDYYRKVITIYNARKHGFKTARTLPHVKD